MYDDVVAFENCALVLFLRKVLKRKKKIVQKLFVYNSRRDGIKVLYVCIIYIQFE